ncbi:MAG: hypothetical protein FJW40_13855 [Acidobacteria bacterium]|nr:hypothetical protein [Acidobacteriota bacterium]
MMSFNRIVRAVALVATGSGVLAAQSLNITQPKLKSKKEQEAVMAVFQSPDPAARIAAVENLLTKFHDTEFKGVALYIATVSAQEANDAEKMIIYAERTLEADPKNYAVMLMLARNTAQKTREFDLDKEEKLNGAEKQANQALGMIPMATKPRPDLPDDQWEAAKKDFLAQGHEALGMIAGVRKKHDVAIAEFKLAIENAAQPDAGTMVRLGQVYNTAGKYDEAIAILDKAMSTPDAHPAVQQAAQNEKRRAVDNKLKGGKK